MSIKNRVQLIGKVGNDSKVIVFEEGFRQS